MALARVLIQSKPERPAEGPRSDRGPAPTPLERLDNLTRALAGPEIWIKRDDCTVVATGGNKVRKLEYLAAEALATALAAFAKHATER